jgi:nucleoside 2-deoxyribosyltransferase
VTTPAGRRGLGAAGVERHTNTLVAPYESVTRRLLESLARIRGTFTQEPPAVRRRRAAAFAAQAVALIDQLDASADVAVSDAVRGVVEAAASGTVAELGRALEVRKGVVDAAVRDLVADLRGASSYALSTARALARAVSRISEVDGTAGEQAKVLERALRDRGLTAVVYRDGSRHQLDTYARMAVRTKLAETWQLGSFDLFRQAGVTHVEISDGFGCGWTRHDDPDKANGTIRSLEEAGAYPLAHPNCGRSSFPRLDVRSDEQARAAQPLSPGGAPDRVAPDLPAVRTPSGRLDTRALAVLAPAAARHAQTLARASARAAGGVPPGGTRRAALATRRAPAQGPTGTS